MFFRNYLAWTIFILLLIWGPINHSWTAWLLIRASYLILLPLLVWLLLKWIWDKWQPSRKIETALERILSCSIVVLLIILALIEANSKTHTENDQWIQTRDGMEAVGNEILVPGPDWFNVFMLVSIAVLFLWLGVFKRRDKSSNGTNV